MLKLRERSKQLLVAFVITLFIIGNLWLIYGYFLTPIVGDVTVNLASIKQAEFNGSWPNSIITSWDLRGFGNKNLMYFLDKASSIWPNVSVNNRERIIKIIYFLLIFLIGAAIYNIIKKSTKFRLRIMILLVFVSTIFSVSNSFVVLQADYSASIIGVLVTVLTAGSKNKYMILGGILAAMTFLFKGVTVLIGMSALVMGLSIKSCNRLSRIKVSFASFSITLMVILTLTYFFAKSEFTDLRDASTLQSSFSYSLLGRLKITAGSLFFQWPHVPVVLFGVVLLLIKVLSLLRRERDDAFRGDMFQAYLMILSLVIALLGIAIQAKGFGYHLTNLIPFSFGILLERLHVWNSSNHFLNWSRAFALCTLVVLCISTTNSEIWNGLVRKYAFQVETDNNQFLRNEEIRLNALEEIGHQITENCVGAIMFLDNGSNYVVQNESWLRYTSPMPLYREVKNVAGKKLRNAVLNKAMQFEGECVTLDPLRMNKERQPWLRSLYSKIEREYEVHTSSTYWAFGEQSEIRLLTRRAKPVEYWSVGAHRE